MGGPETTAHSVTRAVGNVKNHLDLLYTEWRQDPRLKVIQLIYGSFINDIARIQSRFGLQ